MTQTIENCTVDIRKEQFSSRSHYTKIFVFVKGESIYESLINRRQRPYKVYKRLIKDLNIPELKDAKLIWRRKAGCSCGCSPGFLVEGDKFKGLHTIYITVNK